MPWSYRIFGFLIAGYIVYLVSNNRIPKYIGFLAGNTAPGVKVTATPTVAQPWSSVTSVQSNGS